jgi:hypothetical protein
VQSVDKKPNNLVAVGVLALLAILAAGIAHWSMSSNVGVTPDSVVYLSAADRLVEGKRPHAHWLSFCPSYTERSVSGDLPSCVSVTPRID